MKEQIAWEAAHTAAFRQLLTTSLGMMKPSPAYSPNNLYILGAQLRC